MLPWAPTDPQRQRRRSAKYDTRQSEAQTRGMEIYMLIQGGASYIAKLVISNMAVFFMQTQTLTMMTYKELNKAVRCCIWGSSPSKRKVHLEHFAELRRWEVQGFEDQKI